MKVLLVVLLCISPMSAFAFDVDDLIAHNLKHSWYAGKGISHGDSFEYFVCDWSTVQEERHGCYHIIMTFYAQLESYNGIRWVVQAETTSPQYNIHHIFLIDPETLQIETNHAAYGLARSVENTIFYLVQFASVHLPKNLQVGSVWGTVPSPIDIGSEMIITTQDVIDTDTYTFDVFLVQYGLFESSVFVVSPEMPFPISAVAYDPSYITSDPPIMFSFELLEYLPASKDSVTILDRIENTTG